MKRVFMLIVATLVIFEVAAQNRSKVIFSIYDEQTRQPLPGAVIEFAPIKEPANKSYYTSGRGGYVEVSLPMGEYDVTASFMGYADKRFRCNANQRSVTLENIYLKEQATNIDTIVKEVQQFRTTQNADTLIYNAAAFKTTKDAETEQLLSKMVRSRYRASRLSVYLSMATSSLAKMWRWQSRISLPRLSIRSRSSTS